MILRDILSYLTNTMIVKNRDSRVVIVKLNDVKTTQLIEIKFGVPIEYNNFIFHVANNRF